MNKKIIILTITLFILMCIIWNCTMPTDVSSRKKPKSQGGNIEIPVGPENPLETDVVLLNRHMTNYLLYGTYILESTLIKYENIVNIYGDSGETDIKRVINSKLTPSLSDETDYNNAFNYNAFYNFKNIYLYSKKTDNSFKPITNVPISPPGKFDSEELRNEIHGKIYALKESIKNNAPKTNVTQTLNSITSQVDSFFNNFEPIANNIHDFLVSKDMPKVQVKQINSLFNSVTGFVDSLGGIWKSISFACPVVSFFIDLLCPSQNQQVIDVMQENFDIVFQYLDGLVDYLEVIEQKIDYIHGIVLDLGYDINMNALSEIRNELNSTLSLTGSAGLTDQERAEYIRFFNMKIDTLILNYINYIEGTYDYYKRRFLLDEPNAGANMREEMKDYILKIDLPINEKISYLIKNGGFDTRIALDFYNDPENPSSLPGFSFSDEITIDNKKLHLEFIISNPDRYCPYDPAMLKYLHEILLARFQMNTMWKKDLNLLNEFNKDRAAWHLSDNYSIPLIKNKISDAYNQMMNRINNTNTLIDNNINSIQEYLQVLDKDWEFLVTKKTESHTVTFSDSESSTTYGGNFDVFYCIPNILKSFSGKDFYVKGDKENVLGYYMQTLSNYDFNTISTGVQYPLNINNPYRYVMTTYNQFSDDDFCNDFLKLNVAPHTDSYLTTAPIQNSVYPKYYTYEYHSADSENSEDWHLRPTGSPAKLPTKIIHEPDKAIITLIKPDGSEIISQSNLTIDKFNIAEKIKMLAEESYKARAIKLYQLLTEIIAIEVDLNCYTNDPESSSY